jgi:hypothetical protein
MRRRRSERRVSRGLRAALALAVLAGMPRGVRAQAEEPGASFLLVPVGARLVGTGGAGVADPGSTTSPFINPAAFMRLTRPQASLDYGQDAQTNRFVATVTFPSRVLGTVGAGAYVYNPGPQDLTDDFGNVVGRLFIRDVAYAATYGVDFGRRLGIGLTYKYVQYRFDCTGECTLPSKRPGTGAVDFGAQYEVTRDSSLVLGVAVRNLGLRLQIKDRAQSDPLPTHLAVGAAWDVPDVERYVPDASLRVLVEGTRGLGVRLDGTYHVGAEAVYRKSVSLRAGYSRTAGSGYGGPAIGFGFARSRFSLDVARQVTSSGLLADKPPTYAGLRYAF